MAIDYNNEDRSYLYGRLLAVADKAESDTYENEEKGKRVTNARRYWSVFASQPYRTWKVIEEKLNPYLNKPKFYALRIKYEKIIQEILDKMDFETYTNPKALEPVYLLGYHHQMNELYPKNKDSENKTDVESKEED